jgi:hypothetical protein
MKKLLQVFTLLAVVISTTGCATPYMTNRGRDAADIFTACVGMGAGAKLQLGPLHTGLIANADLAGLRGGRLFKLTNRNELGFPDSIDLEGIAYGISYFDYDPRNQRRKNFQDGPYMFPILGHGELPIPFFRRPLYPKRSCPAYFTQIEATGGILGTVRLGFNPGELIDFLLGWGTVDIYKDDIETKR